MTDSARGKTVAVVGAGIFGLSLAKELGTRGYDVTVFDRNRYDLTGYDPEDKETEQAASVDHNKIFRGSYGTKLHYQRLAFESRDEWLRIEDKDLFQGSGMLRVQPTAQLSQLEKETLANMERDGLRHTQFVKSLEEDRKRAAETGWAHKLLDFSAEDGQAFEAVLDSTAGFVKCSAACAHFRTLAAEKGVKFHFGAEVKRLVTQPGQDPQGKLKVTGVELKDGTVHAADVVVVAGGSYSTQLLPTLSYHLESSAGSVATFKIDPSDKTLWEKYSPERFPVIIWKSRPRQADGKDIGSVYVFPRTEEGIVKIGYRGVKYTNFQSAPEGTPFTQDGQWSIPKPTHECRHLPQPSVDAIRQFVKIFLPEFADTPFYFTKLCWYTDSLDNSFVIDYVPEFADKSVFVCTGGSGHGAKFLPVLGKHAAEVFQGGDSFMRPHWRWRPDLPRKNGLEEGPDGPRNIGKHSGDV